MFLGSHLIYKDVENILKVQCCAQKNNTMIHGLDLNMQWCRCAIHKTNILQHMQLQFQGKTFLTLQIAKLSRSLRVPGDTGAKGFTEKRLVTNSNDDHLKTDPQLSANPELNYTGQKEASNEQAIEDELEEGGLCQGCGGNGQRRWGTISNQYFCSGNQDVKIPWKNYLC